MNLTDPQSSQENEYNIPYHFLMSQSSILAFPKKIYTAPIYLYYLERIIEVIMEYHNGGSIFDDGSGDGRLLYELRKQNSNIKISGLDYSERAVSFAKIFNPGIEIQIADLTQNIPFEDDSFDTVISVETLEHIEPAKIPLVMGNFQKMLKGNGVLIVTVPHKNRPLDLKHYQHYQHFSSHTLIKLLEPYFDIESTHGYHHASKGRNLILKIITILYYFLYPLKKLGLSSLLNWISNLGFSYFQRFLYRCDVDSGLSLICVCRNHNR